MTSLTYWTCLVCLFLLLLLPASSAFSQSVEAGAELVETSTPRVEGELPTAMQLYRQYLEKSGGLAHLAELNSIKMSGYMLLGPEKERVEISIFRKRPRKIRVKIESPAYTTETIFDGQRGIRRFYSAADDLVKSEALDGDELSRLSSMSSMDGLFHQLGTSLDDIKLIEWDEIGGVPFIRVELFEGNDFGYRAIWLERESLQESKLLRVFPDSESGGERVEETYFEEMDEFSGYYFPRVTRTFLDSEFQQELHVERIRVNSGIFDSFFKTR